MPTIKTAISIDSVLFGEVEKLALKTHLSRSQIFSRAVESLVRRKDNLVLFQRLNKAYAGNSSPEETARLKHARHTAARLVKNTW